MLENTWLCHQPLTLPKKESFSYDCLPRDPIMLSKQYSFYCSLSTHTFYASIFHRFLKKDVPGRGCLGYLCCCCFHAPQATVTVHLDTAQDLAKQDIVGAGELTTNLRLLFIAQDYGVLFVSKLNFDMVC